MHCIKSYLVFSLKALRFFVLKITIMVFVCLCSPLSLKSFCFPWYRRCEHFTSCQYSAWSCGEVAQLVERTTLGEEVFGSIFAVAVRSLTSLYQSNVTGSDRIHGDPALSRVWQHVKLSDVSHGSRPRYDLLANEDVKKPNQRNKQYSNSMLYMD